MSIGVTGTHIPEKIAWLKRQIEGRVGGPEDFDGFGGRSGPSRPIDGTYDEATAMVVLHVRDRDAAKVGAQASPTRSCRCAWPASPVTT